MAKELMAAVTAARALPQDQLPLAAERLYVLLFQVPAAGRLIAAVRDSPNGAALANLLLASGPALHQDAAIAHGVWLASVGPAPLSHACCSFPQEWE